MRFERDFDINALPSNPIKVLKGPRQVGKTTLLETLKTHKIIYLDDSATREFANSQPRLFFDQLPSALVLDEAALAPEIFTELKRRVDEERRNKREGNSSESINLDVWITSSNQTLIQKNVRESLAGRASYFDLNTLSIHELGSEYSFGKYLLNGGWPELYVRKELKQDRYLNDLISTFIEKDIVAAAGIEKRAPFIQMLRLVSARVGQLFQMSDIAANIGVEGSTIKSWLMLLETNGILREVLPYHTNINSRFIKSSKWYFEDVGLATRLQGWTDLQPLLVSPVVGQLIENIAVGEVVRFFLNRGERPELNFIRTKEKIEVDILVTLPNQRYLAIEVKSKATDFTAQQLKLLESLEINIVENWIVTPEEVQFSNQNSKNISFSEIHKQLSRIIDG